MENFSYHVPFYIVNAGIATSGHSSELKGTEVGLFDRATFSVATAIGNGKELFFAQGSTGGKDWYGQPVSVSHKSPFFYAEDVENMYLSLPHTIQNEEWVLGFNGGPSSVGLSYEKGKPVRVKFLFTGDPTYRFFNGPKEYLVSYTPKEDCTEPCNGDDCPEAIADCLTHTQALVDEINNRLELQKFGVKAKLVTSTYAAGTPNMTKWCITLCDNGDGTALKAVQAQAPVGVVVTRTVRDGSSSTYQFCQADGVGTPVAFTQTGSVLQAVCDVCPAGSTLVAEKDVWVIRRPLAGSEDLTTDAARDTYADTVGTAYNGAATDADKTFIGQDGSVAIVKIKVAAGTVLTALLSDTIELSHTEAAQCVYADPASIAWASCGVGISSRRTMKIKCLNRPDCNAVGDRIADLEAILAGVQGIDIESITKIAGTACCDDYTVEQDSVDCLDEDCLTENVTFTYDTLPAFENSSWELVPVVPAENSARKCGIRISAGYFDPQFGNCSFSPTDFYQTQPVKFEVSLLGEDDSNCDFATKPSQQQTKVARHSRQSGEYVVRESIMKTDAYLKHVKQFSLDPRMREAFDQNLLSMVDRNAFYKLYYVTFKASYGFSYRKNEQETFTAVFAFKEGDAATASFETNIVNVLTAKSGVTMHINE